MTKQARIINDIHIMGYGTLKAGEQYDIIKSNKHYVYIDLNGCTCRLPVSAAETVKGATKR